MDFFQDNLKNVSGNRKREPCCTLNELASRTGVNYQTIYHRIKHSKDAPEVKFTVGNKHFYSKAELDAWHANYEAKKCHKK